MTGVEIKNFAKEHLNIDLTEAQVQYVNQMIGEGRVHVQLTRAYGKTTAAQVAREILKQRKE